MFAAWTCRSFAFQKRRRSLKWLFCSLWRMYRSSRRHCWNSKVDRSWRVSNWWQRCRWLRLKKNEILRCSLKYITCSWIGFLGFTVGGVTFCDGLRSWADSSVDLIDPVVCFRRVFGSVSSSTPGKMCPDRRRCALKSWVFDEGASWWLNSDGSSAERLPLKNRIIDHNMF